jgi:hypothetical protein
MVERLPGERVSSSQATGAHIAPITTPVIAAGTNQRRRLRRSRQVARATMVRPKVAASGAAPRCAWAIQLPRTAATGRAQRRPTTVAAPTTPRAAVGRMRTSEFHGLWK